MDQKKRILVVDDDIVSLQLVGGILNQYFELSMASNAHIALKILDNSKHLIDLIILDFNMPNANGEWMLEMMEKHGHRIPVIMLTGEQGASPLKIAQHSEIVNKYMKKPPSSEILLEEISKILSKKKLSKKNEEIKKTKQEQNNNDRTFQISPERNIENWRGVIGIVSKIRIKPHLKVIVKTMRSGEIEFSIEKKDVWHGVGVPAVGTPIVITNIAGNVASFARPYDAEKDKHLFGKELNTLKKKLKK